MLDGWYCRTLASQQSSQNENDDDNEPNVVDESDESQDIPSVQIPNTDHKAQYIALKKKLKFLLYENEFFQDALRSSQRRLLKVTRDRSFLLDRLMQYEKPDNSDSESDDTDSSEEEMPRAEQPVKKRKKDGAQGKKPNATKRKKATQKNTNNTDNSASDSMLNVNVSNSDMDNMASSSLNIMDGILGGHMTSEELERHLVSQQSLMDLDPAASVTVPAEMFSHEPSLDSDCNDHLIDPSNNLMGDDPRNFILNHSHE